MNIILDANRNSLMLLDLKFSIGTLGIGAGTLIAGLYGMNLKNFLEESDFAFVGVSTWALVFSAVICSYGLHKLRRTQRLTMWGESGASGKRGWRSISKGKSKPRLSQALSADPHIPHIRHGPVHLATGWPPLTALPPERKL